MSSFVTLFLLTFASSAAAQTVDCGMLEAVEPGDTFASIATRCGLSETDLADLNVGIAPGDPSVGDVLTLQPLDDATVLEVAGDPASDPALATYRDAVRGRWQGHGGSCDSVAESWTFDDLQLRGNAMVFALEEVSGAADQLVIATSRASDGAPVQFTVRPDGDVMTLTAPGIAADLRRCAADTRPADATGQGDGPRNAYVESFPGTWRGVGENCDRAVGSWTFRAESFTANGNDYAIRSFDGTPRDIQIAVTRVATGAASDMTVTPTAPGTAIVRGDGFVTDLERC